MKKVTLKFKKEDFNKPYLYSKGCAITTALKRVGYPQLEDSGLGIENEDDQEVSEPKTYDRMTKKVFAMYKYLEGGFSLKDIEPMKPRDFQATLLLDV